MMLFLLYPGMARKILPFVVFLTAFTVVMTILFLSFDLKAKHHEMFNFTQDLDFSSVGQDDPQFIAYVKAVHIQPPATQVKMPGNIIPNPTSLLVANLLSNKVNGTFVETGVYRYGKPSSTEWLEKSLGWSGLLIQANPWDFLFLRRQKRTRASSVHACLSPTSYPKEITYRQLPSVEGSVAGYPNFTRVKCFPLYSLLLAANMTRIDYLSLDAEGAEVQVLKTLPFQNVEISIISIGKILKKDNLFAILSRQQYKLIQELPDTFIFKLDRPKEQMLNSARAVRRV